MYEAAAKSFEKELLYLILFGFCHFIFCASFWFFQAVADSLSHFLRRRKTKSSPLLVNDKSSLRSGLKNRHKVFGRSLDDTFEPYKRIDYTANIYRALRGLCRVSLLWENPVMFTDCEEILKSSWGFPAIYEYYRVYWQNTQGFFVIFTALFY